MPNVECEWTYSAEVHTLKQRINDTHNSFNNSNSKLVTATVYNIHSWYRCPLYHSLIFSHSFTPSRSQLSCRWERFRSHSIAVHACDLKTDLTVVESEESYVRYNHLFKPSFKGTPFLTPSLSVTYSLTHLRI